MQQHGAHTHTFTQNQKPHSIRGQRRRIHIPSQRAAHARHRQASRHRSNQPRLDSPPTRSESEPPRPPQRPARPTGIPARRSGTCGGGACPTAAPPGGASASPDALPRRRRLRRRRRRRLQRRCRRQLLQRRKEGCPPCPPGRRRRRRILKTWLVGQQGAAPRSAASRGCTRRDRPASFRVGSRAPTHAVALLSAAGWTGRPGRARPTA
jgi:hypothetical protein